MICFYKYWYKQFFKFFCIIQSVLIILFMFIDYFSRMERFLNAKLSITTSIIYIGLKVPFMFVQFVPASVLLAAIIVFGLMNKNNELLAIKSSGISLYSLLKPAFISGVILTMVMFFVGETIAPITMAKSNHIKYTVIKKSRNLLSARKDLWIKSGNQLVHINFYNPVKQIISGITITALGKNFEIESRIDAKKGYFRSKKWMFKDVIEQIQSKDFMDYDIKSYDTKHIPLDFLPEDLMELSKKSEEMSYIQLKKYVSKVEKEGYDATTYKVDLHTKIAFPFICIIMVLTGAAAGMSSFVKANLSFGIAAGLVIAFMYWVMYGICTSMGYGMILLPFISAWAANLFFLSFVILYLIRTE